MRTADPRLREQRRAQILRAAVGCFVARGFHQTSMAEIAAASGLSMGLLYRYFRSKDEIVLAAAAWERAESIEAIAALRDATTLRAGLAAYLDAAVDAAFDADYVRIATEVLAESGRNDALLARLRAEDRLMMEALDAALRALQERRLVAATVAAAPVATLFAASIEGLATRALLDPALVRADVKRGLLEHWLRALAPADTRRPDATTAGDGRRRRRPRSGDA
jgi:AcrR family transcriptional regulator